MGETVEGILGRALLAATGCIVTVPPLFSPCACPCRPGLQASKQLPMDETVEGSLWSALWGCTATAPSLLTASLVFTGGRFPFAAKAAS